MIPFSRDPEWLNRTTLTHPQADERIVGWKELTRWVAPLYNAANLGVDSTQVQRETAFVDALGEAIGDGTTLTPRASDQPPGWCIVTRYEPPASGHAVKAGGPHDFSDLRGEELEQALKTGRRPA